MNCKCLIYFLQNSNSKYFQNTELNTNKLLLNYRHMQVLATVVGTNNFVTSFSNDKGQLCILNMYLFYYVSISLPALYSYYMASKKVIHTSIAVFNTATFFYTSYCTHISQMHDLVCNICCEYRV